MLTSIFVYTFVLASMLFLAMEASRRVTLYPRGNCPFFTWEIVVSLVLFAFVFGVRYDVGIDYTGYLQSYLSSHSDRDYELLFTLITDFFKYLGLPVELYFAFWSFLQIFFLLYAFKDERRLYPYLIFALFCGQYFLLWTNLIRQDLAACIVIFAVQYIRKKEIYKYLFWIAIAFGFHRSAIIAILFYPLFCYKIDFTKYLNRTLQIALLIVGAFVFVNNINLLGDIDIMIAMYAGDTVYEAYSHGAISHTTEINKVGLSFLSGFAIDVVLILYSKKLKEAFPEKMVIIYNIYFVGAILGLLFASSYLLLRPIRYMRFFKLVITPYLLYYLLRKKPKKLNIPVLLFVIFMYFILYSALFFYSADAKYEYHSIFLGL